MSIQVDDNQLNFGLWTETKRLALFWHSPVSEINKIVSVFSVNLKIGKVLEKLN